MNKVWNASRFVLLNLEGYDPKGKKALTESDKEDLKILEQHKATITKHLENYRFGQAADELFNFFWHTFADKVIEKNKDRVYKPTSEEDKRAAQHVLLTYLEMQLALLHPFIPFITEEIWGTLPMRHGPLITSRWPTT